VSFVVTNYNYGRYIERAIDSLLGQRGVALELIVIDDRSTDDSRGILERYAGDSRVRLVFHERNTGNIAAYNEGLALARGDIVGTFDADDVCLSQDVVARQVGIFDAHPDVGLVYTGFAIVDEMDQQFRESKPWGHDHVRTAHDAFRDLLSLNTVPHSGALVRRACHDVVGRYDARVPYAGDWDLWLRIAGRFSVGYLAGPLYAYRVHRSNMTSRGRSPGEATGERLLAVENAFAALAPDAPAAIRALRKPALRNALLTGTWNDRSFGRTRRSWIGLVDALRRSPDLLSSRAFYSAAAHLLVLTAIGHPRYERLAAWRESRGRAPLSSPAGSRIR
jgi:glycosyltransferase involved in cell wall biosynthesis